MNGNELRQYCVELAKKSPCNKRKVAALIVKDGTIISEGINYNPSGKPCENVNGQTVDSVIHAERAAIERATSQKAKINGATMYVTHKPCPRCLADINAAGIKEVVIVEDFMKFDAGKLRYDLVPPEAFRALAEVLTYGAKKYKPNNWQNADDTSRYVAALYRHLEAWRTGEKHDSESGLPHLAHALTNVAFLIHFDSK